MQVCILYMQLSLLHRCSCSIKSKLEKISHAPIKKQRDEGENSIDRRSRAAFALLRL